MAQDGVELDVHGRSIPEILARWSLAIVSLVLMAPMGGGFLLLAGASDAREG